MNTYTISISNIVGHHDHNVLKEKLIEIFDCWKITDKVESITIDNGKNIFKAISQLNVNLIRCLGHTINLIVKKVLNCTASSDLNPDHLSDDEDEEENVLFNKEELLSIQKLQELKKKCRNICSKFNHSSQMNNRLLAE